MAQGGLKMIELYYVYDYEGAYVDFFQDYETALSMATLYGGYVLTQTQMYELEEQEDEYDWKARLSAKPRKKNKKIGIVLGVK